MILLLKNSSAARVRKYPPRKGRAGMRRVKWVVVFGVVGMATKSYNRPATFICERFSWKH